MRNSHCELTTVGETRAEKRTFPATQIIDYKVITHNSRVKFPLSITLVDATCIPEL